MVDRPFGDSRPVGPFMEIDMEEDLGDKVQLGVHGTTVPGRPKSPLNILFVLDKHVATLPKDTRPEKPLTEKIKDKFGGEVTVKALRGGSSSSKPFDNQAVVVEVRGDELPVQDSEIHAAASSIERHYSGFGAGVRTVIMDTE